MSLPSSAAFSSAWNDSDDSDCIVTLNYDRAISDRDEWEREAAAAASAMGLRQLSGRSKNVHLVGVRGGDDPITRPASAGFGFYRRWLSC